MRGLDPRISFEGSEEMAVSSNVEHGHDGFRKLISEVAEDAVDVAFPRTLIEGQKIVRRGAARSYNFIEHIEKACLIAALATLAAAASQSGAGIG
jgi:hypothetical protein